MKIPRPQNALAQQKRSDDDDEIKINFIRCALRSLAKEIIEKHFPCWWLLSFEIMAKKMGSFVRDCRGQWNEIKILSAASSYRIAADGFLVKRRFFTTQKLINEMAIIATTARIRSSFFRLPSLVIVKRSSYSVANGIQRIMKQQKRPLHALFSCDSLMLS